MALTNDTLRANEALSGLSDEQLSTIVTLSANDEDTVISTKIRSLHEGYDKDILEVSGVAKNPNEKSYDYAKRVISDFSTKAGSTKDLQTKIETYESDIKTLKDQIKNGDGDAATKRLLKDAEDRLKAEQSTYNADREKWETEKKGYTGKIEGIRINGEFNRATSGFKFKAEYPADVQKVLIDAAKERIRSKYTPAWDSDAGADTMVFRDKDGVLVKNTKNALKPFTASELMEAELKEVLQPGRKAAGAGSGAGGGGGTDTPIDISGARNRVEADEMISDYLLKNGEIAGSDSFTEKMLKIRTDSGVSKLPMR